MGRIIGVQFQENGKMYYFDSSDTDVKTGGGDNNGQKEYSAIADFPYQAGIPHFSHHRIGKIFDDNRSFSHGGGDGNAVNALGPA